MNRHHKFKLAILLLFFLIFLSGCWDFAEVDRRAFVTTIGIDDGPGSKVLVSVQIPNPHKMIPLLNATSGEDSRNFSLISTTASTVNEALNILLTKTYRNLVIEQNKSIIIGAKVFENDNVTDLIDHLTRNPKAPLQALVFICKDATAKSILEATPVQEVLPGLMFVQSAQTTFKYDRTFYIPIWRFEQRLIHSAKDAYAPLISFDPTETTYVEAGLAVFNGSRLVGELTPHETQLFGIITGMMSQGGMTFSLSLGEVTLANLNSKSKIRILLKDGRPYYSIKIFISANISELIKRSNGFMTPQKVIEIEREIEKVLKTELSKVVKKLQKLNSDVLDFGEELRVQHQRYWNQTEWKQEYPTVQYNIDVKVRIRKTGAKQ